MNIKKGNMKIKCVLIDDEPLAIKVLVSFLEDFKNFEIVGSFNNPVVAFDFIEKEQIDAIFLDINMPKINGLDFIRNLTQKPIIVITTAYREYAVESYNLDVLDYLVKPIPFNRFVKSVQKIKQELSYRSRSDNRTTDKKCFDFYKVDKKLVKIEFDDILYIESLKDYIKIFTNSKYFVTHKSLSGITKELPNTKFVRIHRSFTISIGKIKSIEGNWVDIGTKRLPIGRKYIAESKEIIFNSYT